MNQERKVIKLEPQIPLMPKRKRVAAYARVSRESERLMHSLSAQISYYSEYIQNNPEWEYAGVYADSFISGTSISKREEFKRLIADCEAGKIDLILCKSISRFARNTVDLLETLRHLHDLEIDVYFEKEQISSMSGDGEIILTLLAAFSQEESRSISENIKWSIQKKFQKGEQWHVPPFGYRWDGKTFVPDEAEAEVVRSIFEDFLNDVPLRRIAKRLEEQGCRCNTVSFVRSALVNITYTGDVILQKYFVESPIGHKTVKNEGQLPRYLVQDNHPAIISHEVFDAVQAKIQASYEFNPAAHRMVKPSCFSAKIICGRCGAKFVKLLTKTNSHDGLQEHWICGNKQYNGASACRARGIRGSRLREASRIALGLKVFDENVFAASVEKILTTENDTLLFHFYDGSVVETSIQYYNQGDKKNQDPHSRVFGYQWSSEGYRIVPEQADAVRLMYEYYANGMSVSDISRKLEAQGYKTVRGKLSRKVVTCALDSDLYIGRRTVSGQFTEDGQDKIIENDHEPIVSEKLNAMVKARRAVELKKQEQRVAAWRKQREGKNDAASDGHSGNNEPVFIDADQQ